MNNTIIKKAKFKKGLRFVCIFCGGEGCKHENPNANKNKNVYNNLHCNWVNEYILASQRPSNDQIKMLIKDFKRDNIKAFICLQEPGEHPFCGPGILPESGLSYNPELLNYHEISFYNFSWRDHQTTSINKIMKIITVIEKVNKKGGKVLVHCHAGLGRTGIICCCAMIKLDNITAKEAIAKFQNSRYSSLKSKHQKETIINFEKYINRQNFGFLSIKNSSINIKDFIINNKAPYILKQLVQIIIDKGIPDIKYYFEFIYNKNMQKEDENNYINIKNKLISSKKINILHDNKGYFSLIILKEFIDCLDNEIFDSNYIEKMYLLLVDIDKSIKNFTINTYKYNMMKVFVRLFRNINNDNIVELFIKSFFVYKNNSLVDKLIAIFNSLITDHIDMDINNIILQRNLNYYKNVEQSIIEYYNNITDYNSKQNFIQKLKNICK